MTRTPLSPRRRARAAQRPPVPDPLLVVVAGLPGSGKTTLVRRLLPDPPPGVVVYDSEQVAGAVHDRSRGLARAVPYRLLRPWVHAAHRVRVLRGMGRAERVVVLTDPWTSRPWRALVRRAAGRSRRSVRTVLLDAPRAVAEQGQAARGRRIPERRMTRHADRWAAFLERVGPGARGAGTGDALVVDRAGADRLTLGDLIGRSPG